MKIKKGKKEIHILALDQGTTSTRAILFDRYGNRLFMAQRPFKQIFPKNGWVEHNPEDIWKTSVKVCKDAVKRSKELKGNLVAMGIFYNCRFSFSEFFFSEMDSHYDIKYY